MKTHSLSAMGRPQKEIAGTRDIFLSGLPKVATYSTVSRSNWETAEGGELQRCESQPRMIMIGRQGRELFVI